MNIYLIRNKDGKYLFLRWGQQVFWRTREAATIYQCHQRACEAGMYAFQWDDNAEKKFEIEHLIARDETDARPHTKDGELIFPSASYWRTYEYGVEKVRVDEISTTYYNDPERIEFYCRLDDNVWSPPECLYSTEPLAWVAWKEEQ